MSKLENNTSTTKTWSESAALVNAKFGDIDTDRSGTLSADELKTFSQDERNGGTFRQAAELLSQHVSDVSQFASDKYKDPKNSPYRADGIFSSTFGDDKSDQKGISEQDLKVTQMLGRVDLVDAKEKAFRQQEIQYGKDAAASAVVLGIVTVPEAGLTVLALVDPVLAVPPALMTLATGGTAIFSGKFAYDCFKHSQRNEFRSEFERRSQILNMYR